jgi:hypothetical protein
VKIGLANLACDMRRFVMTRQCTRDSRLSAEADKPKNRPPRTSLADLWKTTTFVAGLRLTGMTAPMMLDGPIMAPPAGAGAETQARRHRHQGQPVHPQGLPRARLAAAGYDPD